MNESIGFIGLGVMGLPMAGHLLDVGYSLTVNTRTASRAEGLLQRGAVWGATAADVARRSTVIITMVPDSPDVQKVLAGPSGVFVGVQAGSVIIDMSSIRPAVTRALAEQASRRGVALVDAPVSGGEIGAIKATLSIMVGGEPAAVERVRPILNCMGNPDRVVYIGPAGAGQVAKLCNQLAIGGALATVGEAFALARKAGVDPAKVREALLGGFAASRVLEVHGERILNQNYVPGFRAGLYDKDMANVMETAREVGAPLPVTAVVQQLLTGLVAAGRAGDDYSALATVLFEMAGLTTKP